MTTLLTAKETATRLGLGRETVRAAIQAGHIPSVLIGRSRLVPVAALEAWLRTAGGWQAPEKPLSLAAERVKRRAVKRAQGATKPSYAERMLLGLTDEGETRQSGRAK